MISTLVVDDGECKEVSISTNGEDVLVIKAAGQLGDRSMVVVVHRQTPVWTHQTGIVVMDRLDPNTAVVHSKYQMLGAANDIQNNTI